MGKKLAMLTLTSALLGAGGIGYSIGKGLPKMTDNVKQYAALNSEIRAFDNWNGVIYNEDLYHRLKLKYNLRDTLAKSPELASYNKEYGKAFIIFGASLLLGLAGATGTIDHLAKSREHKSE